MLERRLLRRAASASRSPGCSTEPVGASPAAPRRTAARASSGRRRAAPRAERGAACPSGSGSRLAGAISAAASAARSGSRWPGQRGPQPQTGSSATSTRPASSAIAVEEVGVAGEVDARAPPSSRNPRPAIGGPNGSRRPSCTAGDRLTVTPPPRRGRPGSTSITSLHAGAAQRPRRSRRRDHGARGRRRRSDGGSRWSACAWENSSASSGSRSSMSRQRDAAPDVRDAVAKQRVRQQARAVELDQQRWRGRRRTIAVGGARVGMARGRASPAAAGRDPHPRSDDARAAGLSGRAGARSRAAGLERATKLVQRATRRAGGAARGAARWQKPAERDVRPSEMPGGEHRQADARAARAAGTPRAARRRGSPRVSSPAAMSAVNGRERAHSEAWRCGAGSRGGVFPDSVPRARVRNGERARRRLAGGHPNQVTTGAHDTPSVGTVTASERRRDPVADLIAIGYDDETTAARAARGGRAAGARTSSSSPTPSP